MLNPTLVDLPQHQPYLLNLSFKLAAQLKTCNYIFFSSNGFNPSPSKKKGSILRYKSYEPYIEHSKTNTAIICPGCCAVCACACVYVQSCLKQPKNVCLCVCVCVCVCVREGLKKARLSCYAFILNALFPPSAGSLDSILFLVALERPRQRPRARVVLCTQLWRGHNFQRCRVYAHQVSGLTALRRKY